MYDSIMEEEEVVKVGTDDREMWLEREPDDLIDVKDASIFYGGFPPLPDFPCMSSSPSSSSAPTPINAKTSSLSSSSSSSATAPAPALLSTASMEIIPPSSGNGIDDIDCMYLVDTNDIWDPSSIFLYENHEDNQQEQQQKEDLAMVFFEWLKSNKDSISAEDLRGIKLKRLTIECAARRLGGGKEGKKQLLKLILEWVQNHHLQRKSFSEEPFENPNPNLNLTCNPLSSWIPHPPYIPDPVHGYMEDPVISNEAVASPLNHYNISSHHYCSSSKYHMLESSATWNPPNFVFPSHYNPFPYHNLSKQFPYQLFEGHGERLVRFGSSATKEARKKRMARQRRVFFHHRNQNHQNHQNQHQQPKTEQYEQLAMDSSAAASTSPMLTSGAPPPTVEDRSAMEGQQYHRQISSDRR